MNTDTRPLPAVADSPSPRHARRRSLTPLVLAATVVFVAAGLGLGCLLAGGTSGGGHGRPVSAAPLPPGLVPDPAAPRRGSPPVEYPQELVRPPTADPVPSRTTRPDSPPQGGDRGAEPPPPPSQLAPLLPDRPAASPSPGTAGDAVRDLIRALTERTWTGEQP